MPTRETESAPIVLQIYAQVRRDRMKHSSLPRGGKGER